MTDIWKLFSGILTAGIILFPSLLFAELAAPVYPGAVKDDLYCKNYKMDRGITSPGYTCYEEVYYTKDPSEKVIAFYKSKLNGIDCAKTSCKATILTAKQVMDIYGARGEKLYGSGYDKIELKLEFRNPAAVLSGCRQKPLKKGHILLGMGKMSQNDFDGYCRKYGHLQLALYPLTDKLDSNGRNMRFDRTVAESEKAGDIDQSKSQEKNMLRAQELMMQGRIQEARALMTSNQRDTSKRILDEGEQWKAMLEKLDSKAALTRIVIPLHPKSWKKDMFK